MAVARRLGLARDAPERICEGDAADEAFGQRKMQLITCRVGPYVADWQGQRGLLRSHHRRAWQTGIVDGPKPVVGEIRNTGAAGRGQHQAALLEIAGRPGLVGVVNDVVVMGVTAAEDVDFAVRTELTG